MDSLDGIILVDKKKGMTSHDVVDAARKSLKMQRIGHCGTLDSMATGLIVLLAGKATKLQKFLMGEDKEYVGTILLGKKTDTQDIEGKEIQSLPVPRFSEEKIRNIFDQYLREFEQIPSMFSAIKKKGVPLYKMARKEKEIERDPRSVYVSHYEILNLKREEITFSFSCSKGFYVQTYANDIGNSLGCGGCLKSLKRLRSGIFHLKQAISIEDLASSRFQSGFSPSDEVCAYCLEKES